MTDIAIISDLVNRSAAAMKNKRLSDLTSVFDPKYSYDAELNKAPEFNSIYKKTLELHHKVAIHSEIDIFPYTILRTKAPNQSQEEWDFQRGLYESYTNADWNRAKSKTKIISNKQNYSIEGWDEEQKKYFYEDYPVYHSIESYFFDVVRDKKIDYPNQILLIKPKEIKCKEVDGQMIPDQTEKPEPICVLIEEKNIAQFCDNEYLLVLKSCNVQYLAKDKQHFDGLEFEFYDTHQIIRITQVGRKEDGTAIFEYVVIYIHNYGFLPARKLQGKPHVDEEGNMVYHSIFIDAVPDLNAVIRLSSNLDMSTYRYAFITMMALVDRCTYAEENRSCSNGRIWKDGGQVICPGCNGTGKNRNHSPTGVYEIAATHSSFKDGDALPMTPPVQFAAPDPAILDHVQSRINLKKQSAFSFIYKPSDADAGTATGRMLEEQEFHSLLVDFSNQFFDLLSFAIGTCGFFRYNTGFKDPSIRKPTSFNIRSSADVTLEISEAEKAKMPVSYLKRLIDEANNTRFNSNPTADRELDFIMRVDRVWWMDNLTARAAVGVTITKKDAIIHDSITTFIENAVSENADFWDWTYEKQKQKIYELAEVEYIKLVPKDVGQQGGGNALAESVGGLTGMIEIVNAVAAGTYDIEAAVKLVSSRFGVSEEAAREQLGTPQLGAEIPEQNTF